MWCNGCATLMWWSLHNIYIHQIITLYTWNLHNAACQFDLNKTGERQENCSGFRATMANRDTSLPPLLPPLKWQQISKESKFITVLRKRGTRLSHRFEWVCQTKRAGNTTTDKTEQKSQPRGLSHPKGGATEKLPAPEVAGVHPGRGSRADITVIYCRITCRMGTASHLGCSPAFLPFPGAC